MEEAEGYKRLLALSEPTYTVEQIAGKVGKTPVYIATRLKLTDLCDEATAAFYQNHIGVGHAILLAKLPAELQTRGLTACFKEIPNKDAILADLSLVFMQQDAELFGRIFEGSSRNCQKKGALVDDLVEALMTVHRDDAQVRGVVYQNLERLKLLGLAQSATRKIQAKGTASVPELDPILTWVAISAINAAVHSTSQLPKELQQWDFVRVLVRNILDNLLNPHGSEGRPKRVKQ
jgi:hypothetical protein